ncbi:hypothetical protein [Nonomuraea gerenzanensis]|uniref:Uncharacterized protein n=1 Tax=Nonomuraea gerenzanensis TaxID=93944 RepID=A0A1M4DX82_9ACTN|nr:hypothetical protein [Nonomuraea gerenzanensis]UBU13532.1 hypothetical protein LCN96_00390 [Nonomuraea gerenzanensis]SBO91196.1 hypothetical protein BN4615_P710 [Nonomuraea gerenzanensis]
MARLLRHLDDELYVQGGLCIEGAVGYPDLRDEESEDDYYPAAIRLEAWDSEPPAPGPEWRAVGRPSCTAETGVIRMGVTDDSGRDFLIGPPFFEYGVIAYVGEPDAGRWLIRFWPIRDVFDPLVHLKPRAPLPEPRRVPVPVTTAGQWAAMRRGATTPLGWEAVLPGFFSDGTDPIAGALNPDHASTFRIPDDEVDLRGRSAGGTYRMWRWEWETADGRPHDGNLLTGRVVHLRDHHGHRLLASGIVTMLGVEGRHYLVRDAEPHEAARVLCAEETWPG